MKTLILTCLIGLLSACAMPGDKMSMNNQTSMSAAGKVPPHLQCIPNDIKEGNCTN